MKQWFYNLIINDPYMLLIVGVIALLALCALGAWLCNFIENRLEK